MSDEYSIGAVGYWTQHHVHTGGGRNDDPDPQWLATCETCGWTGLKNPRSPAGWEATAREVHQHRESSREWVPVPAVTVESGMVYACEDENYDFSGLRAVYASLHAALADNPYPWRLDEYGGGGRWVREDGDAIEQTAMSISQVQVRAGHTADTGEPEFA